MTPESGKGEGPSVRKALRVPVELEARINGVRGDVSWSRWVLRAVEQRLEREGGPGPVAAAAVPGHKPWCDCARCVKARG